MLLHFIQNSIKINVQGQIRHKLVTCVKYVRHVQLIAYYSICAPHTWPHSDITTCCCYYPRQFYYNSHTIFYCYADFACLLYCTYQSFECSYTVLVWVINYFYFTWTHLFYNLAVFGGGYILHLLYPGIHAYHTTWQYCSLLFNSPGWQIFDGKDLYSRDEYSVFIDYL